MVEIKELESRIGSIKIKCLNIYRFHMDKVQKCLDEIGKINGSIIKKTGYT